MPNPVPFPGAEPGKSTSQHRLPQGWVEELALNLGEKLETIERSTNHNPIPARLKALENILQSAYRFFDDPNQNPASESLAAEWVLDNFYIIKQAIRQINQNLPNNFYKRLPKANVNGRELTRIYVLASALTTANQSRHNIEQIRSLIQTFQTIQVLTIGELWSLAPMLRLSVLESLASALIRITETHSTLPPSLQNWPATKTIKTNLPTASDEEIVAHSILSLRLLVTQDWQAFFESTSLVEGILRQDPAMAYSRMSFGTRNRYRGVIEELSRGSNTEEVDVARAATQLALEGEQPRARHVGYYLIGSGRPMLERQLGFRPPREQFLRYWLRRYPTYFYLSSIVVLTLLLWIIAILYATLNGDGNIKIILTAALTFLPVLSVAVDFVNWLSTQIVPPHNMPRLDFKDGIPPEFSCMVVIPSLLKNETELESLLQQLENHFLGNTDPRVRFALLTDFVDASEKTLPGEAELVEEAKNGIEHLNGRYINEGYAPFYLFHRERAWNPSEGVWMGWERKRGKLHEFNHLIRGESVSSIIVQTGDLDFLPKIRYVVTLDADTLLPRESVRRLTGILAHPLNQAEFDPQTGALVDGYTILQPRVQIKPTIANRSLFTRVYSGDATFDLYTRAVSDVYQDLFGEGSYVGKGIYDVKAFERSLKDRVPDNTLLSHDLFEGILGRCGLATNVVLFEDFPSHYVSYTHRRHRWIRGDWQLLPWLMPEIPHSTKGKIHSDLSALDRWKLFDNLRRSLTSPAILALIFGGWLFLPGLSWFWVALALFPYFLSTIFGIIAVLRVSREDQYPEATSRPVQQAILRSLLQIVFLPHEAIIALDAIATTIVRMIITRKRLLQWVTAAHTVRIFGRDLKVQIAWNEMMFAPFISLFLFFVLVAVNPMALWLATPFLVTWAASPYIATKISRRYTYRRKGLDSSQTKQLRLLARSTWLYFERFVGPEDHWLPPDHFQEEPRGIVAHRTSPTNIGLLLLSTLSAYDLGYIGLRELAIRIQNTFDGMDQLEKHRKHLLNWYDTRTLEPLPPRYISTVDNGNLAASLIALREGCMDVGSKPIMRWEGLIDTLDMLDMTLREAKLGKKASELSNVISTLREQAENLHQSSEDSSGLLLKLFDEGRVEMEKLLAKVVEASAKRLDSPTIRRLSSWIERTRHHLQNIQSDMEHLYPWSLALAQTPALFRRPDLQPDLRSVWNELQAALPSRPALQAIPAICDQATEILARLRGLLDREEQEAVEWCETFTTSLQSAGKAAGELLDELSSLGDHAASYVQAMNFRFLYNPRRKVFHIGYNVDSGMLDSSYYDLLASEARLTSLVAIAKGDVPQSHWLYLARPITQLEGMRTLLSWSGTMFEYLMPILLTKRYRNTLLDQSCRAAVKHQISYSKQDSQTPWGISESGFYYFDSQQAYQYRAFGVPGLGYKRGLGEDYVVAPYASVLALPYAPQAVIENLELFQKLEMFGLYGLFESIDFTDERLAKGQDFAIVRSYMAHHQGMILLSLCNFLRKDIMVQRFHADPHIETVKLLLQEDIPVYAPIEYARPKEIGSVHSVNAPISLEPWQAEPQAPYPHVHFLSNGNYGLLITAAGSGYSRWQDVDLTRWRADTTLDQYGTYVYIQDMQTGRLWSTTHQPTAISADKLDVRFSPHAAEFMRRDKTITSQMQVTIAAEADVEIRRLSLTNHDGSARDLVLTSFAEVILSPQWTDQRHPAYNKLFIESEYIASENILLFRRRPRSADDKPIYLAHFVVDEDGALDVIGYETDRRRFLGRGYTPRNPAALQHGSGLINMANTLDPIFALQAQISVPGYDSRQLAFVTLAAPSREEALDLAVQYRQWHYVIRAFTDAHMQAEQELTQIGLSSPALAQIQKLLSALLYPAPTLRSNSSILARNKLGQSGLWAFGISGDYPILLLSLKEQKDLGLLNELLRAHHYWRRRRLKIDLVIVNRRETSYDQNFQGVIYRLLRRTRSDKWLGKRGGIFVLREDQMSEAEQILLATVARVVLDGEAGTLQEQLQKLDQNPIRLPRHVPLLPAITEPDESPVTKRPTDLLFDNGTGGFTADGREYVIYLERGQWTPAPWTNVIANPEFGFLVTEAGMGCTWAINSGENRLTPWHNDAVSDPPAEAIYLRDEDTGEIWTPTPLPTRADAPYLVRHGVGYSIFEHASHHLEQNLKIFAVPDAPLKLVRLKLKNTSSRTRRINVTYYAEWVLGKTHEETAQFIVPEFASEHFALLASNSYNQDFSQRVAFLAATRELQGLTTDRVEFLGSLGSYAQPQALERMGLTASALAGKDPCAALQLLLWLAPGEEKEVTFLLGQGEDRADALRLISQYRDLSNVEAAWQSLEQFWDERIGGVQIKTPDPAMDLLVNRWLPYQALSCRIWGRTAFYQSGGAFGFRDQLQDVMLFLHTWPEMARQHILEAARHQFEEGDVLHWWHPPGNRGVRTRITDNLLWLPYVTSQYVKVTGDLSILDEQITFLSAEPLQAGEHERYGEFPAGSAGSLYEHCRRALIKGTTSGPHGLPLMGGGDWNDGMNNIGSGGTGESVWLGWFLYNTLMDFSKISERLPSVDNAAGFRQQAEFLQAALESHAWDGNWYRRAYYDDGTPVGSVNNIDCQIDSISQSWAVISGAGSRERVRIAMDSLYERLVRKDAGLVLLLTPPFDRTIRDPGYIKGYLPGIRENGGQYTHAAIWALWAFADLGQAERVHELFRMINPIYEADTPEKVTRYFVEPYVVAADVYSHPEHLGHGGWTWYTGSSPWMTRLVLEKILGLQREGNQLRIEPCIPADWPHYEIQYRFCDTLYHLRFENPHGVSSGVTQYTLDGTEYTDDSIILEDDGGEHHVTVTIGEKTDSKGKTVRKVRKSK